MVFYTFSLNKGCPRKLHLAQSACTTQTTHLVMPFLIVLHTNHFNFHTPL